MAEREYRVVRTLKISMRWSVVGWLLFVKMGDLLARCEVVDVLVEASSSIIPAGQFSLTALEYRKHLIMMNAEADLPWPSTLAACPHNGVVYTSCDGDQPGVIERG
jgi:predicted homoserine dehydrogenase-like protein